MFGHVAPIVVELGCGKGEYTVGLAKSDETRNYIGVDIKGARMWSGARTVEEEEIGNAAFLRAEIENIDKFFVPGEVDELWITFPDPQMQKTRKTSYVHALSESLSKYTPRRRHCESQDGFTVSL